MILFLFLLWYFCWNALLCPSFVFKRIIVDGKTDKTIAESFPYFTFLLFMSFISFLINFPKYIYTHTYFSCLLCRQSQQGSRGALSGFVHHVLDRSNYTPMLNKVKWNAVYLINSSLSDSFQCLALRGSLAPPAFSCFYFHKFCYKFDNFMLSSLPPPLVSQNKIWLSFSLSF